MQKLILIDGTGEADDALYRRDMENGFLKRIFRNYTGDKRYFRGPTLLGGECIDIRNHALHSIMDAASHELIIAGYSRGGAIAISLCHTIQQSLIRRRGLSMLGDVNIRLLILFDAVDRSAGLPNHETELIPDIVEKCVHAKRDPSVDSRSYFGNCGLQAVPGVNFSLRAFTCTHAAMGGTPWTGDHPVRTIMVPSTRIGRDFDYRYEPTITEEQDNAGSERVRQWINREINFTGLSGNGLYINPIS